MNPNGETAANGALGMDIIRAWPDHELSGDEVLFHGAPRPDLPDAVNEWRSSNVLHLLRSAVRVAGDRLSGAARPYGNLFLTVCRADGSVVPMGLASQAVVTTAGVNKIVALLNTTDASTGTTFKFHGFGTGGTAENASDTALVTEVETRGTGSQTVGGSNNIYRTVGTVSATTARAITEHGVFSASTVGTLLDRTLFSVVNLANGDSIQFTYDLTLPAGS